MGLFYFLAVRTGNVRNASKAVVNPEDFSTVINGYGQDEAAFRREIQGAVRAMKKQMSAQAAH